MNKSQKIYLGAGNTSTKSQDKYIIVKLEQEVKTLEFLTLNLSTEDAYQNFNADYGVLVGRVLANGGIGIPNAKISVFIPLNDTDALDSDIYSIYPYKTPRDKNNEGKRYNLLPHVSQYEQSSGIYKPKQPFGSFFIKPEIVINESFLNVYKKYYKYTALTNEYGDYMIFGLPIGTQTIHMSVDITDIGKYSMTPASMIQLGYPQNLFTDNATEIKPSDDLNDLPNIETQEISVDIIPFWGDTTNFEIGITRQDFRIKATISSDFIVFGTTMTMGETSTFGNPIEDSTQVRKYINSSFYSLSNISTHVDIPNNSDIRTYRSVPPTIRVFTYTSDVPVDANGNLQIPNNIDFDKQIRELSKSEYFEYNENGQFLLSIPCNRYRIITDENGNTVTDDNSPYGVFTRFYGMILINYPNSNALPIQVSLDSDNNIISPKARGWLKIPQTIGLNISESGSYETINNNWRKEYYSFIGGEVYSVAQFYPTKIADKTFVQITNENNIDVAPNTENNFYWNNLNGLDLQSYTTGAWFKVQGTNSITQAGYDSQNYLVSPNTSSPQFVYDFAPNVNQFGDYDSVSDSSNRYFGGQWLNFNLFFPQYGWNYNGNDYYYADVFHNNYKNTSPQAGYTNDNNQKIFAGLVNTKNLLKGDAFQTAFIKIPRVEIKKLFDIPYKGINVYAWNNNTMENKQNGIKDINTLPLDSSIYKYLVPDYSLINRTTGRSYNRFGYDNNCAENQSTAYLFKGMYNNNCIKMLSDFGVI